MQRDESHGSERRSVLSFNTMDIKTTSALSFSTENRLFGEIITKLATSHPAIHRRLGIVVTRRHHVLICFSSINRRPPVQCLPCSTQCSRPLSIPRIPVPVSKADGSNGHCSRFNRRHGIIWYWPVAEGALTAEPTRNVAPFED